MEPKRRRYLSLVGLTISGAIVGCTDTDNGDAEEEIDPDGTEEDEPTEEVDDTEEESGGNGEEEDGDGNGDDGNGDGDSDVEYVNRADRQVVLEYGETAQVSTGLEATVHGVTLYEQMGDEQPEERGLFAVVQISTENTSEGQLDLPAAAGGGWEIFYGDQQHGQTFNYGALRGEGYEGLEGGTVQGGVNREGYILFEINEGYSADEVDTLWSDSFRFTEESGERINVRWTTNP